MIPKKTLFSQPASQIIPNFWDIIAWIFMIAILCAIAWGASRMSMPYHLGQKIPISLDPANLPIYALQTVLRMFIALIISFIFTLIVGSLAAKYKTCEMIIIPLIDILQSVPILGYLSIFIVAFIWVFPGSRLGPECAAIFAVFTGQVWNMTLSFYQSLKTIPNELVEATQIYQLNPWQRFWRLEVPFAMPGLLWNAMISMSAGWFFIVASEAISVANQNITLPGIGSYIALANAQGSIHAIIMSILAMLVVILLYDQLFFRPLVAWSSKFSLTDIPDQENQSWLLDILQKTKLTQNLLLSLGQFFDLIINIKFSIKKNKRNKNKIHRSKPPHKNNSKAIISIIKISKIILGIFLIFLIGLSLYLLKEFVWDHTDLETISHVILLGLYTGIRVMILIVICSIVWVPIGLYIGLNPRLTKIVQPLAQFLAAFPANLLFPLFFVLIMTYHLDIEIWCAPLMILGTQWYILFNIIAGASVIPKELKLVAKNMQLSGWCKWKKFYLPAIFPFYVTGAITASGGAWNASIIAEFIKWKGHTLIASGLGSYIQEQTIQGNFTNLTLGVIVMASWVTIINIVFWRKLYQYAQSRFNYN
jgi:NitT/TauT family transport system permease protein